MLTSSATTRVLVARMDHIGDVLISGPAVRAVAASGCEVVYMCTRQSAPAASLLPGVTEVLTARAEWISAEPRPVTRAMVDHLVERLIEARVDSAVILTSFHQSPLPLALVLRMAGVESIAAISEDYPGSLLDVRHNVDDEIHEVERALSLAEAAGYSLPADDDRRLQIRLVHPDGLPFGLQPGYVVVHPGASVPARAWSPRLLSKLVQLLSISGRRVVVTGSAAEARLASSIAVQQRDGAPVVNLAGRTDLADAARVVRGAAAVVCGNTGPAHLAAAVGTPVVSIYAPTVPLVRWRPWMVPHIVLGDQDIPCAGCRARVCPVAGHPCVESVTPEAALKAVEQVQRPVGQPEKVPPLEAVL